MNVLAQLRDRFATALKSINVDGSEAARLVEMVLPGQDAKFGDYQANCAMPLGKMLGKPPREIAAQLVAALDVADLCESPEIAGPGFINLRLRDDWIRDQLSEASADSDHLGVSPAAKPRTVIVDFSSPNVAKPMHVGHIRSTVIGAALYRILKFLGHHTISDNHLGDWGTQFGMIIYGYKHFADEGALAKKPVEELTRLYKLVHALVEYHDTRNEKIPALREQIRVAAARIDDAGQMTLPIDPKEAKKQDKKLQQAKAQLGELKSELAALEKRVVETERDPQLGPLLQTHAEIGAAVLRETALLHTGDETNRALWNKFLPPCLEEINATYRRLGVSFDHTLGESFYQDRLAAVVADLKQKGLARESNGAICVFLTGQETPMIVQKKDADRSHRPVAGIGQRQSRSTGGRYR